MWNTKDAFLDYTPLHDRFVRVGDDHRLKVAGKGKVKVSNIQSQINSSLIFTDVLHVPSLSKCLISVSALDDKGCTLTFGHGKCTANSDGDPRILFSGTKLQDSRLYQLDFASDDSALLTDYSHDNEMELFHHRMGHCSDSALLKLSTMAQGIPNFSSTDRPFCNDCPIGRMQRLPNANMALIKPQNLYSSSTVI